MIREEIDVHIIDEIFWTISQIVLGYIYSGNLEWCQDNKGRSKGGSKVHDSYGEKNIIG